MVARKKKITFSAVAGVFMLGLAMSSLGVSTYAWFQASARVAISTTTGSAEITVSAPEGAAFYYFTGNGTPGGSGYTGYSRTSSLIGNSSRTFGVASNPSNVAFETGADVDYYFQEINGDGNNTVANCFNLSNLRPGCFFSYCVCYSGPSVTLTLTFAEGTNGDDLSPQKRIGGNPLSLGLALNGCASASNDSGAAAYIKDSLIKGYDGTGDTISYSSGGSLAFEFLDGVDASSNNYLYFSIYLGRQDKSDALLFSSKSGTGSSEILTYTTNASGDYSPLAGLSMTLSSVQVI